MTEGEPLRVLPLQGDSSPDPSTLGLKEEELLDLLAEPADAMGDPLPNPPDWVVAIDRAFASGKPACVNVIIDQKPEGVAGGYEFLG